MEEPVTIIDRDVLKILSVDTRMNILKELSAGDRTPSYLGKRLSKSDATIVEHLNVLCKHGLVKKIEQPGKKWVFYTLTERGYGIVSSKSRRLVIVLGTSILAFFGGIFSLMQYSTQTGYLAAKESVQRAPLVGEGGIISTFIPPYLHISAVLFLIALVCFSFYIYRKSKVKGGEV
jgi:DNA-binding transcriptional ArsR family regulator